MHKINIKKENEGKKTVLKKPIGLFRNKFNKRIFVLGIIIAFLLIAGGAISTSITNEMNINKKTIPDTNLDLYDEIENRGILDRGIIWDATINFNEPGGKNDYVVFGEADDATDGPPHDALDMPKPPSPFPPFIRTWFDDGLGDPYTQLLKDYRFYPDTYKIWNLSVQWVPSDYITPTTITISWDTNDINNSEYDAVFLYNDTGSLLANMITNNNYVFLCIPMTPQNFKIICEADTEAPEIVNYSPGSGGTGELFTFNASVIDNIFGADELAVYVDWSHDSSSGNDTMLHVGGDYFEHTITLDESTSDLTYHFYVEDNAKTPNTNSTSVFPATITDDEYPTPISDDTTTPTTGDPITFGLTITDNIDVNYVYANYRWNLSGSWTSWTTDESMSEGASNDWTTSGLSAPEDTTGVKDVEYYFEVYDGTFTVYVYNGSLAVTETEGTAQGSPFSKPVNDNDLPTVTDVAVDTDPIYDGDLTQQITVTYNEAMDTSVKPTVQITGITTPKIDSTGGSWIDSMHYIVTITLDDDNEEDEW
jgi:hypothetical protein